MRSGLVLLVLLFALAAPAHTDDADTLTVDGIRYRLDGIDAPQMDQTCLDEEGAAYPCGRMAMAALDAFISGRAVTCHDLGPDTKYPSQRIGRCYVDGVDLHRWLFAIGWALNLESHAGGRFADEQRFARDLRLGMSNGCFVAP